MKHIFAWTLVPPLQFNTPPHFKIQPLGPALEVGTFCLSFITKIWPRNARLLFSALPKSVHLVSLGKKGSWVQGYRLMTTLQHPPYGNCASDEQGKGRSMGLEMSRGRATWLSFQKIETAGKKRAILDFLTPFIHLNSWVETTGKTPKG